MSTLADTRHPVDSLLDESSAQRLRARHVEGWRALQGSFDALFEPDDDSGLARVERELLALRIAHRLADSGLVQLHAGRAWALGSSAAVVAAAGRDGTAAGPRLAALFVHADRLTLNPASASAAHLRSLSHQALTAAGIVAASQVMAFVNYFGRLRAGLAWLQGRPTPATAESERPESGQPRFTLDELQWSPWITPVDGTQLTPLQIEVLDESNAQARQSPYYLTLVHGAEALRQRSRLYNAIMYAPGGLPRAERELATLGVSLSNGCVYCASVHARFFAQLAKDRPTAERLLAEGTATDALDARRRAIVDAAVATCRNPPHATRDGLAAVAALRAHGLDDTQVLDVLQAAALFGWANRLMLSLGEPRP
jgi:uncharacterized peroxidase-related enzyme